MNPLRLKISDIAAQDLVDIWVYIAEDNPDAADVFVDGLYERCRPLAETPTLGRRRQELAPGLRSFPVARYVIFYRANDELREIVRVLSGYRDVDAIF